MKNTLRSFFVLLIHGVIGWPMLGGSKAWRAGFATVRGQLLFWRFGLPITYQVYETLLASTELNEPHWLAQLACVSGET